MSDVTRILAALERGDQRSADELLPIVYDHLRQLAAQRLSHEPAGHTLDPTALVHEAYLRLVDVSGEGNQWNSRGHFFSAAAEAMRRILIENARRKKSQRRGGGRKRVELTLNEPAAEPPSDDLLALDEALTRFAKIDPKKAEVVKLRYFAGLTIPQAAEVLDVSVATAERYWTYARAWLHKELAGDQTPSSPPSSGASTEI